MAAPSAGTTCSPVGHSPAACLTRLLASCVGSRALGHIHRPLGPKDSASFGLPGVVPLEADRSVRPSVCPASVHLCNPFSLPYPGRPLPCRPPLIWCLFNCQVFVQPAALVRWTHPWVQISGLCCLLACSLWASFLISELEIMTGSVFEGDWKGG